MATLQKTIVVPTEKKVDVTLPAYFKTVAHDYKIVSENEIWVVYRGFQDKNFGIEKMKNRNLDTILSYEPSTEQEFNEAFDTVLSYMKR